MSEIYSVYVCQKINKLVDNKDIQFIEKCGYVFKDLNKDNVFKVFQAIHIGLNNKTDYKEFNKLYEFICYAYDKESVREASLKDEFTYKKKKYSPIKLKDVQLWIKEDKSVIQEIEEEIMPKVIRDTGAKPVIQFAAKFLDVDESKEVFRIDKTKKTKYSWYQDLRDGDLIVALDFYKNTDYSQADIDWLYTQYRHIYFAFEKNGNEEKPLFDESRLTENKVSNNGKEKKVKTVAQSSKKIGTGFIENNPHVLPIEICRRLWIIFGDSKNDNPELSWFSKDKRVFVGDSKTKDANFVSKVYMKVDFEGIDLGLNVESLTEPEVKHIVNSYIYERRS